MIKYSQVYLTSPNIQMNVSVGLQVLSKPHPGKEDWEIILKQTPQHMKRRIRKMKAEEIH